MDISPDLRAAVLRIRDSIDRFAILKGWTRAEYRLEMIVNVVWFSIIVTIFAKEYESSEADENTRYDEVYDHLERDLKDDPGLYESISFLIAPLNSHDPTGPISLGENHIQIDDSLLNSGWVEPRPISHVTAQDEV